MAKPEHALLTEFVFELLRKHGEELRKEVRPDFDERQQEYERMVENAEFIRDMENGK